MTTFSTTPASLAAAPSSGEWRLRQACLVGTLAVSTPAWRTLSVIWERTEYLGHGYLIPLVAAALLYERRAALAQALRHGGPPALGPLAVFMAVLLEALALIGDVLVAAGLSIPLVFAASAWAVGGMALLRPALLPTAFLVFMVPPPGWLVQRALFDLKLLVTQISVGLLQQIGYPVASEGNLILVPHHTLFVADACSGLTSIVTLLPLAAIVACFLCRGIWRRAILVASIVPLALGANVLRVVITVVLVDRGGIDYAQGLLHESFGLTTFVLGTACLLGLARLLR